MVGCTRLAAYFALNVKLIAQASGRSLVDNCHQFDQHFIGTRRADYLVHARLKLRYHVAVAILNARHKHRRDSYSIIGKRRVCAYHLGH